MSSATVTAEELEKKIALLELWVSRAITYVNGARKSNRTKATAIKVAVLCASGVATILLGLSIATTVDSYFKSIAFALTTVVTVLNALEPFFNYRALWVEHESAKARFNQLYDDIRFYKEGKKAADLSGEEVGRFFADYDKIWGALNEAWNRQRHQLEEVTATHRGKGK